MRWLLLLLLAGPAFAQDVENLLDRERFEEARRIVEERLRNAPDNEVLKEQWAVAVRGQARDLQRADGYDAAIAFLEKNLAHRLLAQAYGETCLWAGREEHGVKVLRRCGLPIADRIHPELRLLAQLRRYDEIVKRAREAARTDWEEFGKEEAALRARLLGGITRGFRAALTALVVILLLSLALYRFAPAPKADSG